MRGGATIAANWLVAAVFVVVGGVAALAAPPKYSVEVLEGEGGWRAEVRFADSSRQPVGLMRGDESGPAWTPLFDVSPDGRWILCVQKTGSGDNVAWLYTVDEAGRVLRVETRLDEMGWQLSDRISKLKRSQLYHTGISDWKWTDRGTLIFALRGSDVEKSGEGVTLDLEYDLARHTVSRMIVPHK